MSEIKNLKPEEIWRNFDALTQIPRPSGHMEKVQQFFHRHLMPARPRRSGKRNGIR